MPRVRIADLVVEMTNTDVAFFARRLQAYRDDSAGPPDLRILFETPATISAPEGKTTVCNERLKVTELADGRRCRSLYGSRSGRLLQTFTCTRDYAEAEIRVPRDRSHPELTLTDFEYLFTGVAFSDRLTYLGGLVLHGSSMAFDGEGVVFSAPSGTGKSTHTGLWREKYGDRVVVLNDDKPAIRFNDRGRPIVYGTPWSGKTDMNCNAHAPLRGIVFLQRGAENAIRRLSVTEALLYMNRELQRPYHDAALGERLLDTATRLLQAVPAYLMNCTISDEAVELVRTTLGLGKE